MKSTHSPCAFPMPAVHSSSTKCYQYKNCTNNVQCDRHKTTAVVTQFDWQTNSFIHQSSDPLLMACTYLSPDEILDKCSTARFKVYVVMWNNLLTYETAHLFCIRTLIFVVTVCLRGDWCICPGILRSSVVTLKSEIKPEKISLLSTITRLKRSLN